MPYSAHPVRRFSHDDPHAYAFLGACDAAVGRRCGVSVRRSHGRPGGSVAAADAARRVVPRPRAPRDADGPGAGAIALREQGPEGPRPRLQLPARHRRQGRDRQEIRRGHPWCRRLFEGHLPQQRWRSGHSRLPVSAIEEARREGACGHGVGARRRSRQLGHHDVAVREGGGRSRVRRDLSGIPRQHRLR